MNVVVLIGRIIKDIEVRYTEKDLAVSNFTIAVRKDYKNVNGEYESDFINCVSFGNISEYLNKYANKGDLVAVKGRIQTRNYEDKEGNKRYITEVFVDKTTLLSSRKNTQQETNEYKDASVKTETNALDSLDIKIEDSDLPF
ncbi:MAG: single-stranded DNA-binding protein [Bacilli bacterium]|nr:single-stranded DNA-binding protein [Bacilli bacterium]